MRKKILTIVVWSVAGSVIGLTLTLTAMQRRTSLQLFYEQQASLVLVAADNVERGLAQGSLEATRTSLARLQEQTVFAGAVVLDLEGASLLSIPDDFAIPADLVDASADEVLRRGGLSYRMTPIEADGQAVGSVWVAFSLSAINRGFLRAVAVVVVLTAILLGSVIALSTRTIDTMIRPLEPTVLVLQSVASGDLTGRIPATGTDEVASLLASVRGMVTSLRELVDNIRVSADEAAAVAEEISASTEEMTASIHETTDLTERLRADSAREADAVRATVDDTRQILGIAHDLTAGARENAERTNRLVIRTEGHRLRLLDERTRLAEYAAEIERANEETQRLVAQTAEVERFARDVAKMADQTDLIALNAAIEAARAGAAGSAFGVVAEEVRSLANQSAAAAAVATKTIGRLTEAMGNALERSVRLADGSASLREVADTTAEALGDLAAASADNGQWAQQISDTAHGVEKLVQNITDRLQQIADETAAFVASAEQIAGAAQVQGSAISEVAASAGTLALTSEQLRTAVRRFRLTRNHNGAT